MTEKQHAFSSPTRGRIKDARGRKVPQLDPVALHVLHRHEPIERDALTRIVGEKGVGLSKLDKGVMIACLILIVLLAGVLVGKYMTGIPWETLLKRSVPVLYLLILPFIMWGGARKKRFGKIAVAMLKHLRCPHCGYDLQGLPADPRDSTTVCPECGCAWRLTEDT
ncbi:MAG: hypothetical protein KAS72_12620 [Phycisphaerales bacterium]|nr:hypothetical protein [Phycisphaerales bacterium]